MTALLVAAAFAAWFATMMLALYLELRIDALVRTGDLPKDTRRIFGRTWEGGLHIGPDVGYIFSRRLRELDPHTRALVPIIRFLLPAGVVLLIGAVAMAWPLQMRWA